MIAAARTLVTLPLVISIGLSVVLGACTRKATPPPNALRLRLEADVPTLDWNLMSDNVSGEVAFNLHDGLICLDGKSEVEPCLAESFKASPDNKVYTFKLRPDLKWSDGQ